MKKTIVTIALSLAMTASYSVEMSNVDEAKFNTAVKAYRMNQNAKALKLFTELHNDYPQNQQIKNNYAVVLFGNGKLEQAEEVLSSVIESNKEVNIAYKNLNKIYDYAAAKAYSNALGTDKEVTPQKLQIIEAVSSPVAVAANQNAAVPQVALPSEDTVANQMADAANSPKVPATKNGTQEVANNVKEWADSWSKADVNSYVATALKDSEEPAAGAVIPAVLNQAATKPNAVAPVALSVPPVQAVASTKDGAEKPMVSEVAVVEDAVRNWAQAWSKGDADSYVTYYEPSFRLGKMSHNQWIRNRKERVTPVANIKVKLSDLIVTPSKTDDTMIAYFKQNYQADHYQDLTSKQLIWKKIGDKWFIKKEIKID